MKNIRSPKSLVYVILLILLMASVAFYFAAQTSLAENLFTTTLGMIVTLFVIDTLLQLDKSQRYKSLNKSNAHSMKASIAFCILAARGELGDKKKYKAEDVEKTTRELTELFDSGLKKLINVATEEQLEEFCTTIADTVSSIDKTLDKIVPHPSVEAKKLASDLAIQQVVITELIKVHSEISEITANSKPSIKEVEILGKLDDFQKQNYLNLVNEIRQNLLRLHKLASDDSLQEII